MVKGLSECRRPSELSSRLAVIDVLERQLRGRGGASTPAGPAAAVVTVLLVLALVGSAAALIAIGLVLVAFGATVAGALTMAVAAGLLYLCWIL